MLKDCIELQEKKEKVVVLCSSPPQNEKLGTFFHVVVVQLPQTNVQKALCTCKVVFLLI